MINLTLSILDIYFIFKIILIGKILIYLFGSHLITIFINNLISNNKLFDKNKTNKKRNNLYYIFNIKNKTTIHSDNFKLRNLYFLFNIKKDYEKENDKKDSKKENDFNNKINVYKKMNDSIFSSINNKDNSINENNSNDNNFNNDNSDNNNFNNDNSDEKNPNNELFIKHNKCKNKKYQNVNILFTDN
jgi:hypothetical protein